MKSTDVVELGDGEARMPNRNAIDHYERMASHYDSTVAVVRYTLPSNLFSWVQPHLSGAMSSVLDIGIGTGLSSKEFQANGFIVTGVDGSQSMLDQCRAKKIGTTLIQADVSGGVLPIRAQKFDIILCIGVFEFVLKPSTLVKHVAALAAPNGLLVLAIRDPALNPHFSSMRLNELTIDRVAFEKNSLIAVHHEWTDVQRYLNDELFAVLEERQVLAYTSPTQGFDTFNRVVICRRCAP